MAHGFSPSSERPIAVRPWVVWLLVCNGSVRMAEQTAHPLARKQRKRRKKAGIEETAQLVNCLPCQHKGQNWMPGSTLRSWT